MYSIILVMAMTGGSQTVAFGRGQGGCGCYGCHGCSVTSCHRGYHGCQSRNCQSGWDGRRFCYAGSGCFCGGVIVTPAAPVPSVPPVTEPKLQASIKVTLPADAVLLVDGTPTKTTSATRVFATPDLEPGKTYSYTLKAEVVRDGRKVTETQRVSFSAGQEQQVRFDFAPLPLSASR